MAKPKTFTAQELKEEKIARLNKIIFGSFSLRRALALEQRKTLDQTRLANILVSSGISENVDEALKALSVIGEDNSLAYDKNASERIVIQRAYDQPGVSPSDGIQKYIVEKNYVGFFP